MLPKQHRLHTSYEIGQVRRGQRFYSDIATLFVTHSTEAGPAKFAFVVSTKISKKAVDRNRTRRLLRESVHQLLPRVKPGVAAVCIAKTSLASVPLARVQEDVTKLLTAARILE